MTAYSRRSFLQTVGGAGVGIALSGSVASLVASQTAALAAGPGTTGYGALVPDPAGLLDLPHGFHYRVLSRSVLDHLDSGDPVPGNHDGMAAFPAHGGRTMLIRNHELNSGSETTVPVTDGITYDPSQKGGTTNVLVRPNGRVERSFVSLAGTIRNCAGGMTPWGTWITCEETEEIVGTGPGVRHGYAFEVGQDGGNRYPIRAMGRFPHEAVCIDPGTGVVYLTEDASDPFGHVYRFQPRRPLGGPGSLHKGGTFQAMKVPGVATDLSEIDVPGTVVEGIEWVDVPNRDPGRGAPTRTQTDATHIQKAEGTWWGTDGTAWIVSSFGRDTVKPHDGQVFRYDPVANTLTLVVQFGAADPFDGPDNITISPWGFAFLCEDGEGEQFVIGVDPQGEAFPFARNALNGSEFAGACFSPNGRTMFFNIQDPGYTFAVTGPFRRRVS